MTVESAGIGAATAFVRARQDAIKMRMFLLVIMFK